MINNMPATKERPDDRNNHPPEIGRIIEKIKRRGSDSLTPTERMMVVEIFRAAAMTGQKHLFAIKEDIQRAHLSYCWRLTK
jgi:hypothetical protein